MQRLQSTIPKSLTYIDAFFVRSVIARIDRAAMDMKDICHMLLMLLWIIDRNVVRATSTTDKGKFDT